VAGLGISRKKAAQAAAVAAVFDRLDWQLETLHGALDRAALAHTAMAAELA
jgi:hypothetical protein